MKKCLVLLGSYNGEKYIEEQIDSILNQKNVEVYIKVADDCSTDGTHEILKKYKEKYSNFDYYINEKNKNFTYNFLDLLFSVKDMDFDYYAFADQDDFWLENKLESAIKKLDNDNKNGKFYCSNLILVDQDLKPFGIQEKKSILKTNKYNYVVANIATGCTVVFDSKFYKHAIKYYPKNIKLHDYWLFLIAAFTADYEYDLDSYIYYRQHGNNQIGSNKKFFSKKRIKNFFRKNNEKNILLSELIAGYGEDMSQYDKDLLIMVRDYKKRFKNKFKLLFSRKIKRHKFNLLFKLKVLFNKF